MSDWGDDELDPADVDDAAVDQATGEVVDEEPAAEPSLYYGSVDEFLREYLRSVYRRMGVLMDPQGPFAAADAMATEKQCSKGDRLPYEAPPEGLFPDVRELDA